VTNLIIANVETPSHDDSNSSQLFFRRSLVWGSMAPSVDGPLLSTSCCCETWV